MLLCISRTCHAVWHKALNQQISVDWLPTVILEQVHNSFSAKTIIHDYVLISVTVSGSIRVGMLKMSRVNQRETKVFFYTNMKPWVLI